MTNVQRIRPMTLRRFTPLQRTLHWVMAVCILAMLFIGVGMVVNGRAGIFDAREHS